MPFRPRYVNNAEAAATINSGTAVVIDVLRAFTTAAWAFALGAERILLSDDVEEALAWKASIPGALALKDASAAAPVHDLSSVPVPQTDADPALRSVISFSLFGTNQRYTRGALANIRAARILYPTWTCRFHVDDALPTAIVRQFLGENAEVKIVRGLPGRRPPVAVIGRVGGAALEIGIEGSPMLSRPVDVLHRVCHSTLPRMMGPSRP